jgi:hypothetical protein
MPLLPHLAEDARLYVEAELALPDALAPGLTCLKRGQAGQVHYHLYSFETSTGSA